MNIAGAITTSNTETQKSLKSIDATLKKILVAQKLETKAANDREKKAAQKAKRAEADGKKKNRLGGIMGTEGKEGTEVKKSKGGLGDLLKKILIGGGIIAALGVGIKSLFENADILGRLRDSLFGDEGLFGKKNRDMMWDKLFNDQTGWFGKESRTRMWNSLFGEDGMFGKAGREKIMDSLFGEDGWFGSKNMKSFNNFMFGKDGIFGEDMRKNTSEFLFGQEGIFGKKNLKGAYEGMKSFFVDDADWKKAARQGMTDFFIKDAPWKVAIREGFDTILKDVTDFTKDLLEALGNFVRNLPGFKQVGDTMDAIGSGFDWLAGGMREATTNARQTLGLEEKPVEKQLEEAKDKRKQLQSQLDSNVGPYSDPIRTAELEQQIVEQDKKIAELEGQASGVSKDENSTYTVSGITYDSASGLPIEEQQLQSGGPVRVPGTGSGDKVPMNLSPGSFVLNREASKFLFRQEGGPVPTLLEPGEHVFSPGSWESAGIDKLNSAVPRFQKGGETKGKEVAKQVQQSYDIPNFSKSDVGDNLRYISTGDAMNLAKMQTGGLVLFQGHGDVPAGHSQPGTDGPNSSIYGKYKPTAEQHFMDLIAKKAAAMSNSVTYSPPTGKYSSGFAAGANWQRMRDLRKKGQSAIEIHADGYDGKPGGFKGKPGVLPGTSTGPTGAVGDAEKKIREMFGMYGGTRTANILELDNIMKVSQSPDKYAKMLVQAAEGTGTAIKISTGDASHGGGNGGDDANVAGTGVGSDAILEAAKANIGLSKGISEQCANTVRAVLKAAGHPSAMKTTSVGDLEPDGVPSQYRAPSYAASFGGTDMGNVKKQYSATSPGDIILWKGTYGVDKWGPDAITHVGIKGEGQSVWHHGTTAGFRNTGPVYQDKFVGGITLNGSGSADGSQGESTDGTNNSGGGGGKKKGFLEKMLGPLAGFFKGSAEFMQGFMGPLAGLAAGVGSMAMGKLVGPEAAIGMAKSGNEMLGGLLGGINSFLGISDPNDQSTGNDPSTDAQSNAQSNDNGTTGTIDSSNKEVSVAKNLMKDLGITKEAAAGIVANLSYESAGMTPGEREGPPYGKSEKPWPVGTVGEGYGWAQWTNSKPGDRLDKFISHIGGADKIATDQDNYSFLLKELRGPEPLMGHPRGGDIPQDDAVKAADWFRKNWERAGVPADGPRRKIAKEVVQKLQTGGQVGSVPTLLEPGETVGNLEMWNQAIPRFQSGGAVNMSHSPSGLMQRFYEQTNAMEGGSQSPVIINNINNAGGGQQQQSVSGPASTPIPALSGGPSMSALSDIINRVSWSNVF